MIDAERWGEPCRINLHSPPEDDRPIQGPCQCERHSIGDSIGSLTFAFAPQTWWISPVIGGTYEPEPTDGD